MKRLIYIFLLMVLVLTGCTNTQNNDSNKKVSIIAPSGTPALALSSYFIKENVNYEIVGGSDPLVSAFTNATHDIIVAPVNLGAKLYKANGNYIHYKTIVWGNTYIVSKSSLNSLNDLEGKSITAFGESSTPGIVLKALLKYYNINCDITFVDDVATANSLLMSGQAEIVLSAEPSLSKINANKQLSIIDLQDEWKKMTGSYSYPQAAIFVKKEIYKNTVIQEHLKMLDDAIKDTSNPSTVANVAVTIDETFSKLGVEVLTNAIPNCHYELVEDEISPIVAYFNILNDLGLSAMYGNTLPDESFYAEKN